jgi:hypothetical protein
MTMAMRRYAILMVAAAVLLTGCFHKMHELKPSEWGDVPVGYVAASFQWDQADDASEAIHSITLSFGGSGASFSKNYNSVEDVSADLVQLPVGDYDILVTANMTEADGYILTGRPATRADLGSIKVSLKSPASSPAQAWYGVSHVTVTEDDICVDEITLVRLLSTLTVSIDNLPSGATVVLTLSNVAENVDLTAKDAGGNYGLPSTELVGDLTIPNSTVRLLPTASGKERCMLTVDITSPSGVNLSSLCDAPRMEVGKSYTLNLDYNKLQPYMYLTTYSISNWEVGWTVSGEVLNPNN